MEKKKQDWEWKINEGGVRTEKGFRGYFLFHGIIFYSCRSFSTALLHRMNEFANLMFSAQFGQNPISPCLIFFFKGVGELRLARYAHGPRGTAADVIIHLTPIINVRESCCIALVALSSHSIIMSSSITAVLV